MLEPKEVAAYGEWPDAAFWVDMRTNFAVVSTGPLVAGPRVKSGMELGEIDLRSVAPKLAACLVATLPNAEAKDLGVCGK